MPQRPIPKIRQLEALISVITTGSMTTAAAQLGISQPAISRLLADLAKDFDFQLFEKRNGQLRPSHETRILEPDIRRVLELMRRIADVSGDITRHKAGHLRVACLPGFATSHLPSVVTQFLRNRESVSMTIEPDRPERILEWIINEQYDLGITDGFHGHPAVDQTEINLRTVCCFPTGHVFEGMDSISPKELDNLPLIHTRKNSAFYRDLATSFQTVNARINTKIEVRQFTAACELICQGLGVSVVSELDAAQYVSRGLSYRPFAPAIPHKISLVRPVHKAPSLIALEFSDYFETSLEPYIMQAAELTDR